MAVEVRYDKSHHAGGTPEARIANRQRNSGEGSNPNNHTQQGSGPQRVHHNIHNARHYVDPATAIQPNSGTSQRGHDAASVQDVGYTPKGGGDDR